MDILITGASGFLGTHVVKELIAADIQPVCHSIDEESRSILDKAGAKRLVSDLSGIKTLDHAVHLAARVHMPGEKSAEFMPVYRKVNVDFAMETAKTFLRLGGKTFIFVSTVNVYGDNPGRYDETSPLVQTSPYGLSKIEAESKLTDLFRGSSAKLAILRPPMLYGPGNKGNMLPLLRAAARKLPLPLGATSKKRSTLYVGNLVSAIMRVLEAGPGRAGGIYNIKDHDVSSAQLYSAITKAMGSAGKVFYFPKAAFDLAAMLSPLALELKNRLFEEYLVDDSRFRADYDWSPPCSFEESVKRTVEWYIKR